MVVGLARGGVVVAREIAARLNLPLDVLVVKKIPSPYERELAVGALAPDGVSWVLWPTLQRAGADEAYLKSQIHRLEEQIKQQILVYRKGKKPLEVKDKIVILTDDGVATGATMEAAIKWCRKKKAQKIIVAAPVASPEVVAKIKPEVKELVILEVTGDLVAVGQFYRNFDQVEDGEVVALLQEKN